VKGPCFEDIRRRHQQILEAVARLEAALSREGSASEAPDGGEPRVMALGNFLDFCESTLEPHMRDEEQHVYPLLDRYLAREIGSVEAMLREHETARGLVPLLRQGCARLRLGAPEVELDVAVMAQDLALLLRDHIRKEDGVINPLLERLLEGAAADGRRGRASPLSRRARRGRLARGTDDP
jgi:hemerythrin-like domain-containing protein